VGPNREIDYRMAGGDPRFQSSVRINVGPNVIIADTGREVVTFQSSVRINVGPNPINRNNLPL